MRATKEYVATPALTAAQTAYLLRHRVARLATVAADGQPHVVPVCFAVVNGAVYTPLDRKPKRVPVERLRRVLDLQANPRICLTADLYDEDWQQLSWLQIRGEAELVLPGAEQAAAVDALRARYAQYATMPLADLPVIRIKPLHAVSWHWPEP